MSRGRTGRPRRYPGGITLSIARLKALLGMMCRATMGPSQVPAAKQKCGLYDYIQMQMPPARRSPPDRPGNMVFVLDSAGLRVEHGGVQDTARTTRGRLSSCTPGPARA
ncbi:hypothetical protein CENSYa_1042 [Cenarchaeum symbiosum A]|uniref:Transposase n=1 Tax=Cenarchaeum symbiosum (strain A) TaxID=414004 RepID=A0RWF6_CENSY|nr:hypothetical protein CENSYa_1042 [Cenarchaeum symbiosum A]